MLGEGHSGKEAIEANKERAVGRDQWAKWSAFDTGQSQDTNLEENRRAGGRGSEESILGRRVTPMHLMHSHL